MERVGELTNRVPIGVKHRLRRPSKCCFEFLFRTCVKWG
jgi:hypothetical protein